MTLILWVFSGLVHIYYIDGFQANLTYGKTCTCSAPLPPPQLTPAALSAALSQRALSCALECPVLAKCNFLR